MVSHLKSLLILTYLQIHSSFEYTVTKLDISLTRPDNLVYDSSQKYLYFSDSSRLYCYDKKKEKSYWVGVGGSVGMLIKSSGSDNEFITSINNKLVKLNWDGSGKMKNKKTLNTIGFSNTTRYDDGSADKKGRVWASLIEVIGGEIKLGNGSLYYITKNNKKNPTLYQYRKFTQLRGIVWNKSNKKVYYALPERAQIIEHTYTLSNGTMSNPKIIFDLHNQTGNFTYVRITSLAMDSDNHLWAALFNNGTIYKINPENGKVLKKIHVPAAFISNVLWGGKGYSTLYVTGSIAEDGVKGKHGRLFAVTGLGSSGSQVYSADIS